MSLTRRQEVLVHSKFKNTYVVRFIRPHTYPTDTLHLRSTSVGIKVWEAMGKPEVITVTIEAGDQT